MSNETARHSTIARIQGINKVPGVTQYLGIQYATLKDRFSRGELIQSYAQDRILDARKLGPLPLSPENGCEWEQKLLQHTLEFPEYPQSDTECLTLNIAVPDIKKPSALPILLLVHGGAFATGSSSYPQYDLARITKLSLDQERPMVVVGINYRLGVPGFLTSSAMRAAGYKPNNGLDDQKLAFRWIKRHISSFSGDPGRITFIGESAGGASGCFHLHSDEPLFHRLISMSGTSLLRARRPELLEKSFSRIVDIFGWNNLSPGEQVQELLDLPMDELRAKVGRQIPIGPMVDGDIIPEITTFQTLANDAEVKRVFPGIEHCKKIIMGDCQMDAMALAPRLVARTDILSQTFVNCLSTVFDSVDTSIAHKIARAYGLDPTSHSNDTESKQNILEFGNDICFAAAARSFAKAWSASSVPDTESLLYMFNCRNPWEGPWKGHATHILDIAFVLMNYAEYTDKGQQCAAERFAEDIISFVNGERPWERYQHDNAEGSMVYDAPMEGAEDLSRFVKDGTSSSTGRRNFLQKIVPPELFDRLMDAWQMFMAGP
ncbi:Alpha/Beta hydrolase protein [Penicillium paradoxum]|uniref:Alpha/Beta hydrolase protein n=1 Tax=Penicillium paradoxum TaxID=176176 RepID=UPI0025499C4D|nr:Alpha/Beta hydrolase protein [Penicillium paradoxum]KAJ5779251.1 Alpha/Beta hydrolase protein [Penicillium paradoxum]